MSSVQRVPSRVTSDKGNTQVPEAQTQPTMADLGRGTIPRQPEHSLSGNFSGSDYGSGSEAGSDADLPQVTVDMIPLSVIVTRMVTYAYTELVTLIETLPSRTEENRREEIQKYTQHIREQLTKLLVLVKWSRNAPQIQKCQNAIAYLQSQNEYFTRAVDGLYATYLALPQARLRNYDVPTAVDVLTTGTYRKLPSVVKEAFVPPPMLTRAQVAQTLEAINGIIRARILRGEPVPTAMRRYSIDGGRVTFTVAGEFEATLTLLQYSNVPWHVVGIKLLVGSDPALTGEMAIRLDKRQTNDMAQHCQTQLLQESEVPQLARLYDFLHMQSLSILLDTVAKQAAVLRRVRWENLLQIEMGADKSVVLRYWTSSRAAAGHNSSGGSRVNAIVIKPCPLPVPRPIHASAIEGPDALEASPDDAGDKHEFLRIEQDRRNLIPKLGLSITWTAHSGLGQTHTWSRTVAQASELSEDLADGGGVVLDSEGINAERLLRQVTWRHSVKILESLYSSVVESGLFDEGAVELLYGMASGEVKRSVSGSEITQAAVVPKLRAWYRQDEGAVDITVDAFTGRLVVRASEVVSVSASLSEAMIGQLADQANRTPWRLAELLVDMRSSLALADLDSLAFRSLGLRPMGMATCGLLPGFVLTGVRRRVEASVTPAVASAQSYLMGSPAVGSNGPVPAAANFPLRISQQEADALMRGIGTEQPLNRVRFYKIEGCDGEWYLMGAMTDRLHFRLVLLNPHPKDQLMYEVGQVIALQVDRLFSSVARRLLAEKKLDPSMVRANSGGGGQSKRLREDGAEWDVTERVDAMLSGRTSITLDYLNALASMCRARLALRLLQTQLTEWKIPYSFRIPSFSTSPHGHRAAVSKELSVVGLDKQGLYELDEQVPILYLPIAALMRASPINWHVASSGVLADEARRMVSVRIASDELDPAMRSDSARLVEYRTSDGKASSAAQTLVGRHVIPCQVIASVPVALDGLPAAVSAAHADAVYFGAHAGPDGGYHGRGSGNTKGGYSKMMLVYKNVGRALQSLIRDWSEHHLMTHVARQLCVWEQRSLRRMLAATTAFYPFCAGPYTSALAKMLGANEHAATELVLQCLDSRLLSISCRVPEPFTGDQQGELSYHLTMAEVEPESNRILRIGSTWPWAHGAGSSRRRMGFEVSADLSRWLRTLQARMNLTGNPLSILSLVIQMTPLSDILSTTGPMVNIRSLSPSLALDSMIPVGFARMLGETEPEDKSKLVVDRLMTMKEHLRSSLAEISGLNVMPMYTAADNIRLVFNTRFVVDVRLVAYDTFHISDVVASARVFAGSLVAAGSSASAPAPLVTAAMEPIPRFAQWLEALSTKMTLDWAHLEEAVAVLFKEVASDDVVGDRAADKAQRIRNLQRNMHRLRPGATKVEAFMYKFRELHMRQNSARAPPFVPLPPTALLCTNTQLLVTLRSLMMWMKMSVNVVDSIEAVVSKYVGTGHLGVDEVLVDRQEVLVAYTGCRGTVRCEYKLSLDAVPADDEQSELQVPAEAADSAAAEKSAQTLAKLVGLFSVPKNLLRAAWDVRILPIVRPPKGVSERVAAYLSGIVDRLGAEKTASTLVKLLAMPAHLLEDTVHIAMEMTGKVSVASLETSHNFSIVLDTDASSVCFALTFTLPDRNLTVVLSYMLLTGTAEVVHVIVDKTAPNVVDQALEERWCAYVKKVIKKLDDLTAFTLDMGKDGKSRWLDIVKELHAEAYADHQSSA